MDALVIAVLWLANLAALGAGGWLGIWVARRVPLTLDLAGANPTAMRVSMYSIRVFVFLICLVSVATPVTFVSQAIVNAR